MKNIPEKLHFEKLYKKHLRALKLQGKSDCTINGYARAVRRIAEHFGCSPDNLSTEQLKQYFADLLETHSWSTVKVDRCGLMFFWEHVLERDWQYFKIIKPPKIQSLPDVLTIAEVERLIATTRNLRYRVFLLTTYSMGLRLSETLFLQVGDIDGKRKQVHIRRGKGHKDRFLPLPDLTYQALRALWSKHRNPIWLFPNANGKMERIKNATSVMDKGGVQKAMKAVVSECGIKKKYQSIAYAIVSPHICWSKA